MKKMFIVTLIFILAGGITFGAGFFSGRQSRVISVHVDNSSGKNIAAATVEHERGTAVISDIKQNRKKTIHFFSSAENTYRLNVIFDDNTSLYSERRHAKPGSKITETVTAEEIKTIF